MYNNVFTQIDADQLLYTDTDSLLTTVKGYQQSKSNTPKLYETTITEIEVDG